MTASVGSAAPSRGTASASSEDTKRRPAAWAGLNAWLLAAVLVATVDLVCWSLALRDGLLLAPGWGIDFATYHDAARSWVGGTGFYLPYELAGPFTPGVVHPQPVMYPPTTAPLFLVLTAIPAVWWAGPFAIVGWRLRHAPLERWLLALALLAWPGSFYAIVTGNPGLWIMAALSLGLGSVVLLKPTLAPFLLVGIRSRRWWLAAGAVAIVSLAVLPLWADYLTVLRNVRGSDFTYSLWQMPLIAVGVITRTGSNRTRPPSGTSR